MKIIDSHNHFWKYHPHEYAWISDDMSVLKKSFLPEDLQYIFNRNGVSSGIAVQARQNEEENKFLFDLADNYSFVEGVVGWIDLHAPDLEDQLQRFVAHPKAVGIRHMIQSEKDEWFMLNKTFLSGVKRLQDFGLAYDILISYEQLPVAVKFVEKLPGQKLVLDHIAKPPIWAGNPEPWKTHIFEIARHENLYCKISGLVTEADRQKWKEDDIKPYLDVVFEAFGADRLMFGSDWPVCLLAADYARVLQLIWNYIEQFSREEQEKILGLNTRNFYSL